MNDVSKIQNSNMFFLLGHLGEGRKLTIEDIRELSEHQVQVIIDPELEHATAQENK